MSDDKDELDASDWLAGQFAPTEQVPKQAPAQPIAPPPTASPLFGATPAPAPTAQVPPASAPTHAARPHAAAPSHAATPPVVVPPAVVPPAVVPTQVLPSQSSPGAVAPSQNSAGGFNWGLRPGGGTDAASPVVPAAAAQAPVAPTHAAPVAPTHAAPPLVVPPDPAPTTPFVPPVSPSVSEPTQPFTWDDFAATQSPASPAQVEEPTQAYTVQSWEPAVAQPSHAAPFTEPTYDQHEPTSAIDSLFGDHRFQEYEEVGVIKTVQATPIAGSRSEARVPREPLSSTQRALMLVAGGLIAVLLLIGCFFIGQHLGAASAAAPAPASTPGSKSTPTSAGNGGPAAPGVQPWTALQGGECIQPFSSAWTTTFTVVSCSADHSAQMVFKGKLSSTDDTGYPTTSQFQTQLTALCSAPTAINYTAAASVTDLQVSFSYPPSAASWIAGNRTYYCFVDRVSGGSLPGDLSVPNTTN